MARITVEDCTTLVPNRFELVVLATKRGKDIASGSPIYVSKDNDKNAVIALREIASGKLDIDALRKSFEQSFDKDHVALAEEDHKKDDTFGDDLILDSELSKEFISYPTEDKLDDDSGFTFADEDLEVDD
jgi:DNA-directed RNA polymerase subunit omega